MAAPDLPLEWSDGPGDVPQGGVYRTYVAWCRCGWHYAAVSDKTSEQDAERCLARHRDLQHVPNPDGLPVCTGARLH